MINFAIRLKSNGFGLFGELQEYWQTIRTKAIFFKAILILWLLFPLIWFYFEPEFMRIEQLEELEEDQTSSSKQLPNRENFVKTRWLCGTFLLLVLIIESK